ncbi:beta-glycosyltransferase/ family 2 [Synechococcus sp. A15-60]|nr:beta-glycosyltransferase/ family 2 [Synechococcus sp. A15-60]
MLLIAALLAGCIGLLILQLGLMRVFSSAPSLQPASEREVPETSLCVVIPAFNEALNVGPCLSSVLRSATPCRHWHVLLVDDASTDDTVEQAQATASALDPNASRFDFLQAGPRPVGERWVGKNWACARAMQQVQDEWILFLDADVQLKPQALHRALSQAIRDKADLLSLAPRLRCDCLAEWMVQPIMASLLGLGFPIEAANDPDSDVAFAAGPFMLFRRCAYEQIGGHQGLAAEVVEDLALARLIKRQGLRLRYLLGLDAVDLRMYFDLASLWEGWTKNWLLGLDGDPIKALGASAVVVLMFSLPWLLLPASVVLLGLLPSQAVWWFVAASLSMTAIVQQFLIRRWNRQRFDMPISYWWLMGAGGLLVGAIGPVSVWRTLTGRGWTWKGRQLT